MRPSVDPWPTNEEDALGLDLLRTSDAAAPSASERGDEQEEEKVVCMAEPKPDEGDDDERVVCMAEPKPDEGEDGDETVVCMAEKSPDEGEEEVLPAEDLADIPAPTGLAERWHGDPAQFEEVWSELKAFLLTASTSTVPLRPPSVRVDELWHEFILFTREYHAFCKRLGGYVHHTPEVTVTT